MNVHTYHYCLWPLRRVSNGLRRGCRNNPEQSKERDVDSETGGPI